MEADRKSTAGDSNIELDSPFLEKITYRVGSKVISPVFHSVEISHCEWGELQVKGLNQI